MDAINVVEAVCMMVMLKQVMYFMHDGASPYSPLVVRNVLVFSFAILYNGTFHSVCFGSRVVLLITSKSIWSVWFSMSR